MLVGAVALLGCLLGLSGDSRQLQRQVTRVPKAPAVNVAETERDGALRVLVVTGDKQAVGRASLRVLWEQQRRYFDAGSGVTNDEGVATVTRVPRGRVWLLAEAEGYARASTQLIIDGGAREVTLELAPATELRVRVSDEAGGALPSATVLVTSSDPLPFGALTDGAGRTELKRLGKGPFTLKVSAPGYESVSRSGVSGSVEITLRRLGSLTVMVQLPDGKKAGGATVEIGGATLWPARSAQADQGGVCKIAGLLAGSYDLRARQDSNVSRVLMGLTLERGEDKLVTLLLEPGRFVTALVNDGSGPSPHLVPNADVVLAEEGLSSFPLRGRTGTDGKVTLGPISNGPATLSGRAPDFVGSAVVAVPDVLTGPVPLPLLRGGSLSGDVVDARGFPVDGASIEVIGSDSQGLPIAETPQLMRFRRSHFSWALAGPPPLIAAGELGVMPGPIPPIPGSNAALAAAALDSAAQPLDDDEELAPWITDGSGHFRAAPVTPGRVRALVRHPDFVEGVSEAVLLAPGGEAHVEVVLLRGGSLEGRVKDERDQPIENAEVEVVAERGTFQRASVTASDGSFAFSALPREVTVNVRRAENPTRIAKRIPLEVEEGKREVLDIVLPALRDPITITVLDDEGRPLELAEVSALSLDPGSPLRTTGFSDAEGKLEIADAQGLQLRIAVQAPGFVRQVLVLGAADAKAALELKLQRGSQVVGRVTALRGRRGVEGALVTLSNQGLRKTATTNADGQYQLSDLALGRVRITVSHPDFAEGSLETSIEATGRQDRPFELKPIDLEEPGAVEGEVLDERGDPVAGARVALGRAPSYLPAGPLPRGVAVTDARGAFSLQGLPSGPATLDVLSPDRGRGSARIEVQSNRTQSGVRITLKQSGSDQDPFAPGGVAITLGERGEGAALEVVVVTVAEGSEAERAGMQPGDVIAAINDAEPSSMHDARSRLSGPLQTDVVVSVSRNGAAQRFSVLREAVRK
ncbi:MAG TPA: carboxypeptidase regulatory-like domain-containing protein [Polyangiaceae bacterium]|nr:carboxypeptidase regulatory-like domain-containing protein [Polyangiaceae bacterium]